MSFTIMSEKVKFIEDLTTFLESQRNKKMSFQEDISTNNFNYDRHFTTSNRFEFRLDRVYVRFSGSRLGIEGTSNELYEIDVMRIASGEKTENIITIIEELDGRITRKSVITII